jgi:aspartyl-tRNA(Asn)/glutamyl-tRNA(Gln) amidotransferase subunit B
MPAAPWIADTLIGELNYRGMNIDSVDPGGFTALLGLIKGGSITDKSGIEVLRMMLDQRMTGQPTETPAAIVERLNLSRTSSDDGALAAVISEVIAKNPQAVEDYQNGRGGALNFLVGQAMKKTRGRSDPGQLNRMISGMLGNRGA